MAVPQWKTFHYLLKGLEDLCMLVGRNAYACVPDGHTDMRIVFRGRNADGDLATVCEFQGISNKVHEYLTDAACISNNGWHRLEVHQNLDALLCLVSHRIQHLTCYLSNFYLQTWMSCKAMKS